MFQLDYQENGFCTGKLCMNESRWFSRMTSRPTVVSIVPAFSRGRQEVEDFIIGVYAKAYGAQIGVHYPVLMSVRGLIWRDEHFSGMTLRDIGKRDEFSEGYVGKCIIRTFEMPLT